jgi:hypothetical protein
MSSKPSQSSPVAGVAAITAIPQFYDSTGATDFAVSYQTASAPAWAGIGGLLRWDGTAGPMTALPVSTGSTNTVTSDWNSFRKWFPGIKEGRLMLTNQSTEPVTVTLYTSADSTKGCWYAPTWADAPAFPSVGVTIPAGTASTPATTGPYTMGVYTAGSDGLCAVSTETTDPWRGYVVVTPVSHPADQRVFKLNFSDDMAVDVNDQAGGAATAAPPFQQTIVGDAAFGRWQLNISVPAGPAPYTVPTVSAARVTTAAMTSGPPVYRFDVRGAAYQLPLAYSEQMTMPPLVVQGWTNSTGWVDIGSIVPTIAPTIVPQDATHALLQVGPSTFWYEHAAGAPAYTELRVGFGTGTLWSAPVTLAPLPPPQDGPITGSEGFTSATLNSGTGVMVNSGIDQVPLTVVATDVNNNDLGPGDPHYARIYYRTDQSNALVTNLIPVRGNSDFIGVTPYAGGAYTNNGNADSGGPGVFQGYHYLATNSTQSQKVYAYLSYGDASPVASSLIEIAPVAVNPLPVGSTVAVSLSLSGCTDFVGGGCRLAAPAGPAPGATGPVTPVMYAAASGGPATVGLLTAVRATTSTNSLPLTHGSTAQPVLLGTSLLDISPTSAHLADTSPFGSGAVVDTNLVTHGVLVPLPALAAG